MAARHSPPRKEAKVDKTEKYIKLMELTGIKESIKRLVEYMLEEISQASGAPLDELEKQINTDDVVRAVADKDKDIFTEEELDAQIAFLGTPLGQSIIKKTDSVEDPVPAIADYVRAKLDQYFLGGEPN